MIKANILLVEDDENLGFVTQDNLQLSGYKVTWAKDGVTGFEAFCKDKFDLCILDVMLPKKDGFQLGQEIKTLKENIPMIFLTAKSLDPDKVQGFKIGADDYITKPFNMEILSLRIQALLKRHFSIQANTVEKKDVFKIGKYNFDYKNQELSCEDFNKHLTKKEAEILRLLCLNKNKLLTRDLALKVIWGENDYFKGRSMDVFITKLRKYLSLDEEIEIINVHGTGFKLKVSE
ncbi:MAG: DNA-binding response regulator [Flavobacteriales bacterium]|nr:DNA-binding response regulator [Flavobacteriales bacterium]MBO73496.1 DNA-binding response regulator [Flavobacteriales bacterium]|tara:strand:- start:2014 stop:2712 length:699 start_codon:yes stop_codon:yes gene_type:complete